MMPWALLQLDRVKIQTRAAKKNFCRFVFWWQNLKSFHPFQASSYFLFPVPSIDKADWSSHFLLCLATSWQVSLETSSQLAKLLIGTFQQYFIFTFTSHGEICRHRTIKLSSQRLVVAIVTFSYLCCLKLLLILRWCPLWGIVIVVPVNKRHDCEFLSLGGILWSRRRPKTSLLNISELQQTARPWSRGSDVFSLWPTWKCSEWQHNQRKRKKRETEGETGHQIWCFWPFC